MPNIQPFRTLNEYDVINLYSYSGTLPVTKGTVVMIISGWYTDQELAELGDVGAHYNDVVSLRYGVKCQVCKVFQTGQIPLGILLNDVREFDENGEKLIYKPKKAAQMQCVVSGQAVPVAVRGMFLYSGINGSPAAGAQAFSTGDGTLSTTSSSGVNAANELVGKFLGPKNAAGHALVWLDL